MQLDSDHWNTVPTELDTVLKTWTEESSHNYSNALHINKVFNAPGANVFIVEFDPRCATERKYDYLEFISSNTTSKYDGRVNSDLWPSKVEFKGSKLHFVFHSDQSNNDWGYKFTVRFNNALITPLYFSSFSIFCTLVLLLSQV